MRVFRKRLPNPVILSSETWPPRNPDILFAAQIDRFLQIAAHNKSAHEMIGRIEGRRAGLESVRPLLVQALALVSRSVPQTPALTRAVDELMSSFDKLIIEEQSPDLEASVQESSTTLTAVAESIKATAQLLGDRPPS